MVVHGRIINLKVKLDESYIILRGSNDEAPGLILGGVIIMRVDSPVILKKMELDFINDFRLYLSKDKLKPSEQYRIDEKILLQKRDFLECFDGPKQFTPGEYTFSFSLPIQGSMVETTTLEHFTNKYHLKVVAQGNNLFSSAALKEKINIKRDVLTNGMMNISGIDIQKTWKSACDIRITVPTNVFSRGSAVETTFLFQPRVEGLVIMSVGVIMLENVRYSSRDGLVKKKTSKIVSSISGKLKPPPAYNSSFEKQPMRICTEQSHIERTDSKFSVTRRIPDIARLFCCSFFDVRRLCIFNPEDKNKESKGFLDKRKCGGTKLLGVGSDTITMYLPENKLKMMYDSASQFAKVSHRLKFTINIKNKQGHEHCVWLSVPVYVVPSRPECLEYLDRLPLYKDVHLDQTVTHINSTVGPPSYSEDN